MILALTTAVLTGATLWVLAAVWLAWIVGAVIRRRDRQHPHR